jgi:hypothetical protein
MSPELVASTLPSTATDSVPPSRFTDTVAARPSA